MNISPLGIFTFIFLRTATYVLAAIGAMALLPYAGAL